MDREALKAQQADLARKLKKRQDQGGYAANVEALKTMIAEITTLLAQPEELGEPQT